MSSQANPSPNQRQAAAAPVSLSRAPTAEMVQHCVDQAAYFNVFSRPDPADSDATIRKTNDVIGIRINEAVHRFEVTTHRPSATRSLRAANVVGERIGRFSHRWMLAPNDFVGVPDRVPPPTPLDPARPQRFVMLDGKCIFGDGADGFRGFGTGQTIPTTVNGHPQLLATAIGTIVEGFGNFQGHEQGTYVYCGTLVPERGFTGNMMLRVMDPQKTLGTERSLPTIQQAPDPEAGITYVILRGEAVPSDPVTPNIGPDGKAIGLVVQQGLKLQYVDSATRGHGRIRATDRRGQLIGRITAYVAFDPASAGGTALDPVAFTAYDEFVFFGPGGEIIGSFTADSSEGRVFNMSLLGQPAIRFGGVGSIRSGAGPFEGIEGLMTDNSVVVFAPHVSASIYVLRIDDRGRRFRAAFGRS
jgi:hypothetical protein